MSYGLRAIFIGFMVFNVTHYYRVGDKSTVSHSIGRQLLEETESGGEDDTEGSAVDPPTEKPTTEEPTTKENKTDDALFPPDAFFHPNGTAYGNFFYPNGTAYATNNPAVGAAVILHLLGMIYMFYALALVCDHYFVPALDVIIEKLGVSPDVAGATFMAAGGSAPELFTAIIGVFIATSDVGIGTIVGSAVFNVLFVIAACAFASKKALDLTAWPLLRDTLFYSIALMMLVGFFVDNKIQWWEALILFMWYGAYVGFMKVNGFCEEKFLTQFPSLRKVSEEGAPEFKAGFKFRSDRRPLLKLMKLQVETVNKLGGGDAEEMKPLQAAENGDKKEVGMEGLLNKLKGDDDKKEEEKQDDTKMPTVEVVDPAAAEKEEPAEEYQDPILSGPQGGPMGTIVWVVSLPLMFPLWLTLPDMENPEKKKWFPVTFFGSILWIACYSYFMVWWATIFGRVVGISDAVMGLTVLAAGTSVPDLITSVLVAKQGHGDMAVSSSIGSNIFDVTVGLPLPWLLWSISKGGTAMKVTSKGMGCSIGMLFLMLMIVIISIIAFKWKMTKPMGGIMVAMYGVFVAVSLLLTQEIVPCPFDPSE